MENKNKKGFAHQPDNKNTGGKAPDGKPKIKSYWFYIAMAVVFVAMTFINFGSKTTETDRKKFETEMLASHDVEKIVVINREKVEIYIKAERIGEERYQDIKENKGVGAITGGSPHYFFTIGDVETFERQLAEAQKDFPEEERITAQYKTERNYTGEIISWILPILLLVGLWIFMFRRMNGKGGSGNQIFSIGKSKAQLFDKEKHIKTNFKDVAGLEEAKIEVMEIVDFLKSPQKYTELGGKIPKGALLVGPPGTGKTLLAKAVAGEANVPFFSISGSDFVEMFVGVGASRVRDLFKQAKQKAPCIVFIDEIDAVGRARGRNANMGGNDERENTLNQLLTEMDGFGSNSGVIILAATNRADVLDKALLRAGRFDRQIHVELPDLNEREAIFKVHLKPILVAKGLILDFLAKQTPGFSGADIANACNEAALIAARHRKKQVEKQDFLDAIDRIVGGLEKKNKIISPGEKKTIAYHESGHATVSWLLEYANPLVKVTIIPRGKALGAAWYLPEERSITTTEQMLDEICSALGGRASEELIFGKISTGALNDLEKVTKQAFAMVAYYGMSDNIGNLSYYDSTGQSDYNFTKPFSEKTAEEIDKEVHNIVEVQYQRALKILKKNKKGLTKLAEFLLEKEVMFSEDLEAIFGPKKGEQFQPKAKKVEESEPEKIDKEEEIIKEEKTAKSSTKDEEEERATDTSVNE